MSLNEARENYQRFGRAHEQIDVRSLQVRSIWIEAEEWAEGEWSPVDQWSDAIVTLEDDSQWVASFVTYRHIETLRERDRQTGECLCGSYFWMTDLIIINEISRVNIERVVNDLLVTGEFRIAFDACEADNDESD